MRIPSSVIIDPRKVLPSRHTLFLRGFPSSIKIEEVRELFSKQCDSRCRIDFFSYSEDRVYLFVAVRFDSHSVARRMLMKYDGEKIFGHRVKISWFRDIRKARKMVIENGKKYQNLLARPPYGQSYPPVGKYYGQRIANRRFIPPNLEPYPSGSGYRQRVSSRNSSVSKSRSPSRSLSFKRKHHSRSSSTSQSSNGSTAYHKPLTPKSNKKSDMSSTYSFSSNRSQSRHISKTLKSQTTNEDEDQELNNVHYQPNESYKISRSPLTEDPFYEDNLKDSLSSGSHCQNMSPDKTIWKRKHKQKKQKKHNQTQQFKRNHVDSYTFVNGTIADRFSTPTTIYNNPEELHNLTEGISMNEEITQAGGVMPHSENSVEVAAEEKSPKSSDWNSGLDDAQSPEVSNPCDTEQLHLSTNFPVCSSNYQNPSTSRSTTDASVQAHLNLTDYSDLDEGYLQLAFLTETKVDEIFHKKRMIEAAYRLDCDSYTSSVSKLIRMNPDLKDCLLTSLRKLLEDRAKQSVTDLQQFIKNLSR